MKSYKQILSEVAQPKPADEINFKAKHEIEFMDHPASEEGQHSSNKKKVKRIADYEEGEDMGVYENADEENSMYKTQLEFIKYAADEIMEYVSTGLDTEEWFQNKLAKVHGDMTTLHAYMEGDKRKNDGMDVSEATMTDDHWAIVKMNGRFYSQKSEIKKIVRPSKNAPSLKVLEKHGADSAIRVGELKNKLKNMRDTDSLLSQLGEAEMTADQKKRSEEIVKGMKKNKADMQKRYGDDWESVMYATANKQAMKESLELDEGITDKNKKDAEKVIAYAKSNKGKGIATKSGDNSVIPNIQIVRYLESIGKVNNVKELASGRGWSFELKESVELDEASQPKWEVIVRKSFTTNGKTAKKGSSVEVSARNTAEAIDKATKKMGFGDKAAGISGSNFDLKKLKESIDLDEAVKSGNIKLNDGTRVSVSKDDATAINNLFDNLSTTNKKSMETTMLKNKKGFDEIMNFAKEAM